MQVVAKLLLHCKHWMLKSCMLPHVPELSYCWLGNQIGIMGCHDRWCLNSVEGFLQKLDKLYASTYICCCVLMYIDLQYSKCVITWLGCDKMSVSVHFSFECYRGARFCPSAPLLKPVLPSAFFTISVCVHLFYSPWFIIPDASVFLGGVCLPWC